MTSTWARSALALLLMGCIEDATRPRTGVPTLDDAGSDAFASLSAGREHTCALTADGTAYCWGSNEFGQLGIDAGATTCARDDRDIPCWPTPAPVETALRFRKIAAGGVQTCALGLDERVYCWGDNLRGALGDPSVPHTLVPAPIASTALFTDIAAGAEHSCALRTDGIAMCWGANEMGQVGTGSSNSSIAAPAALTANLRFASLTASGQSSCGRLGNGASYCWGKTWVNRIGGADITRPQNTPSRVQSTLEFRAIETGANTTCAITTDNDAYCWQANATGAMGDGSAFGSTTPQLVSGGLKFTSISSGALQTCGIADTGYAYCWGANGSGQIGVSSTLLPLRCSEERVPCAIAPVRVSGWRRFAQVVAGEGGHSCGLTTGGNIYCWGAGSMGQRGDGRLTAAEWSPVKTRSP